jgi:uncharacterized protein YbbC (DUF1343 family)
MLLGSERLLASSRLKGLRVGVLANPASIDGNFRHIVDRLAASPDWTLAAIFGPQHGFPLGPPGQHDRDAAHQGSAAQRANLLASTAKRASQRLKCSADRCW